MKQNSSERFEFLLSPISMRTFRMGSTSGAITMVAIMGLAFFSIADFREIGIQERVNALSVNEKAIKNQKDSLAAYLETKNEAFSDFLSIAGHVQNKEENPYENVRQLPVDERIRATINRLEKQVEVLTSLQSDNEDLFWHLPNISPIDLSKTQLVGDSRRARRRHWGKVTGVSSKHGMRFHPRLKRTEMHKGVDIFCPNGSDVLSTANGTVVFAGLYTANQDNLLFGYGKFVVVQHGDTGIETLYAHLSDIKVQAGQLVKRGQVIGLSGNSGSSTGPHLHYEVSRGGEKVNPLNYIHDVPLIKEGKTLLYIKDTPNSSRNSKRRRT